MLNEKFARRWLSVAEVAERLGLSAKTIRNQVSAGRLPASHPPGLPVRIDWRELEKKFETHLRILVK